MQSNKSEDFGPAERTMGKVEISVSHLNFILIHCTSLDFV